MKGRCFFAHFLTTFSKSLNISGQLFKSKNRVGRFRLYNNIYINKFKVFILRLRQNRLVGLSGQSIMEYFVILAVVAAVMAVLANSFLDNARESGQMILDKAVNRIIE